MSGLGTVVGIICGILINVLLIELLPSFQNDTSSLFFLVCFPILGAVEGVFLGLFQYNSLKKRVPGLKLSKWIIKTSIALSISWTLGMLSYWYSSTFAYLYFVENLPNIKEILFVLVWMVITGGLGAVLGFFQMLELRKLVRNARSWVTANFLSWSLMIPFVGIAYFLSEVSGHHGFVIFIVYITLSFVALGLVSFILGLFFIKLCPIKKEEIKMPMRT